MSAYQLLSLGFIAGFGVGGLFMLWLWRRVRPEDFGRAREIEIEPVFVFEGTFDGLAANRGWHDHSDYRWVIYAYPTPEEDP